MNGLNIAHTKDRLQIVWAKRNQLHHHDDISPVVSNSIKSRRVDMTATP